MAKRNLSERQRAKNIGATPPERRWTDEDGVVRVEKLNPIPLNRKFVDPDGNVVRVSLANGYTIRGGPEQHWRDNPYGAHIWAEKLKAGFIVYAECPLAAGTVPTKKGEHPCEGEFDEDHCCPHVEAIIKRRRAEKQKKVAQIEASFASNQDRMVKAFETALASSGRGLVPPPPDKTQMPK